MRTSTRDLAWISHHTSTLLVRISHHVGRLLGDCRTGGRTLHCGHAVRSFGVRQLVAAFLPASLLAGFRTYAQFPAGKLAGEKAAASCRTPKLRTLRGVWGYGNYQKNLVTAISLALLLSPMGTACALAGRPEAHPPFPPASSEEKSAPLSQDQTLKMLQAGVPSRQIEVFARRDGVDFKVTPSLERDLRKAGATESLIQLLKKLGTGPAPVKPLPPPAPRIFPRYCARRRMR